MITRIIHLDDEDQDTEIFEQPKVQEFSYIEVRKLEKSYEKTPILHIAFSLEGLEKENLVFFVRKSLKGEGMIKKF